MSPNLLNVSIKVRFKNLLVQDKLSEKKKLVVWVLYNTTTQREAQIELYQLIYDQSIKIVTVFLDVIPCSQNFALSFCWTCTASHH